MGWKFNPPPGWPVPSGADWVPPADWRPEPDWPAAPPGWEFWVQVPEPPAPPDAPATKVTPAATAPRRRRGLVVTTAVLAALAMLGVVGVAVPNARTTATPARPAPVVPAPATGAVPAVPAPEVFHRMHQATRTMTVGEVDGEPVLLVKRGVYLQVLDLATGAERHSLRHGSPPFAVTVGELDGAPVAVAGDHSGRLRVWDLTTGEQLDELVGHDGGIGSVATGELGGVPIAATGGSDQTVRVWDLTTGEQLGEALDVSDPDRVTALAIAEAGDRTLVIFGDAGGLQVWALTPGEEPVLDRFLEYDDPSYGERVPRTLATGELAGTPVAVSAYTSDVVVWDLTTGEEIARLDKEGPICCGVRDVALAEDGGGGDGGLIAVVGYHDINGVEPLVRVWDLARGVQIGKPYAGHLAAGDPHGVVAVGVANLADQTVVVSADDQGRVLVWPLPGR